MLIQFNLLISIQKLGTAIIEYYEASLMVPNQERWGARSNPTPLQLRTPAIAAHGHQGEEKKIFSQELFEQILC